MRRTDRALPVGLLVSAAIHLVALLALIVVLPAEPPPEEPQEVQITMDVVSPTPQSAKAPKPADVPAPANTPTPSPAPQPAPEPAKPVVEEAPSPPPPPPPPPPPEDIPPPVDVPPPVTKTPPPPPPAEPVPSELPPPPPLPPMPPVPKPPPPLPLPPPPAPPPPAPVPAPPSKTSQPNATKNAAADSQELNNTLEKLRALQAQQQPPKARANPAAGGAPQGGGSPNGDINNQLSASQRGAIGDRVRECWTKDAGALDIEKMRVKLTVTTDSTGMARLAVVAPEDLARVQSDVRFKVFTERAVRAILDPRCASLPLPKDKLGSNQTLTFVFAP